MCDAIALVTGLVECRYIGFLKYLCPAASVVIKYLSIHVICVGESVAPRVILHAIYLHFHASDPLLIVSRHSRD